MLKIFLIFTIFSQIAFAQTKTPTPTPTATPAGNDDPWRQLGVRMGLEVSGLDTVSPTSRPPLVMPKTAVIPAQGRRCVHMVSQQVGGIAYYFRKNYWFNITAGQKTKLSKKAEYYGMDIGSGEGTNGWHLVPKTAYDLWVKLTNTLSPNLINNCRVPGAYFPPTIVYETKTPGCDVVVGADIVPTQQFFSQVDHPDYPEGPSILWNTRLRIKDYNVGAIGVTALGAGSATIGLEIFKGDKSTAAPSTQVLTFGTTPNNTVLFPFNLASDETFVIRGSGVAGSKPASMEFFFQNLPVVGTIPRIPDTIIQCGTESPSASDIATLTAGGKGKF